MSTLKTENKKTKQGLDLFFLVTNQFDLQSEIYDI